MNTDKTAAVIMAGGRGERLRPITDTVPKPLVPVGNRPACAASLMMLSRIGIKSAYLTVKYRHEMIKDTFGEEYEGVKLRYIIEKNSLGTAGGVRNAFEKTVLETGKEPDETVVLSGDAVSDYDLSVLINLHRVKNATASFFLSEAEDPSMYGTVTTDSDGKIEAFTEKPKAARPHSLINSGIYILSSRAVKMIPSGKEYDFGRDLFPTMLKCGEKLYGIRGRGYWCDIGTPTAYVNCCHDAVLGKINGFSGKTDVCGAVISENSRVGDGSLLKGCVIHEGVSIGEDVRGENAVFCRGASVGCRVTVGKGSVIGANSYIGDGVRIPEGTKIAPNSKIGSGAGIFAENL